MINFDYNVYENIVERYLEEIEGGVYQNYQSITKNPKYSEILDLIPNKKDLQKILSGQINSDNQSESVINYRKNLIFSSIRIAGMSRLKEGNETLSNFYKNLRGDLLTKYDNPILQNLLLKKNSSDQPVKSNQKFKYFQAEIYNHYKTINEGLEKIFMYDKFLGSKPELRAEILVQTNIFVCPYCNRQFISKYEKSGTTRSTAQLDHFYPKSKFPLFALSLYNFVPICSICNSIFKRSKVNDTLYPFNNRNNTEPYFKINYRFVDQLQGANTNFEIEIAYPEKLPRIERNLFQMANDDLGIQELYNSAHKDFVAEINMKKNLRNEIYKNHIQNLLGNKNISDTDLDFLLFGFNQSNNELFNKPLSKLAHDILKFPND